MLERENAIIGSDTRSPEAVELQRACQARNNVTSKMRRRQSNRICSVDVTLAAVHVANRRTAGLGSNEERWTNDEIAERKF